MWVKDFITKDIPVLKSFDTGEYAMGLMEDWKVKQLPLLKDNLYHSLISEKDLLELPQLSDQVGDSVLFAPALADSGHLHAALSMMTKYGLSILPVIDSEGVYLGVLTRDKMLDALAQLCSANEAGSVVTLELLLQDYVLSDIARIVESNNGHIINLLSYTDPDTGRLIITLKIDLIDIMPVIRSFERFNYTLLYYSMEEGIVDDVLQKRMDELLYYMNM